MNKNEYKKTYYALLGVTARASQEEIRLAFRRKAREFHPDVCNRFDADEMFKLLNRAYSVLKNKKTRQKYNEQLMADMFQEQVVDPSRKNIRQFGNLTDFDDD